MSNEQLGKYLESLSNKTIKVDRGGPESRIGRLLEAHNDYIILLTEEDGVVYYKTQHVKSITENVKESIEFNLETPENFEFITAENFKGILNEMKYHWVNINRGGPEKIEGIINDVTDEMLTLVLNEEVIRLAMYHVRNISYGNKPEPKVMDEKEELKKEEK